MDRQFCGLGIRFRYPDDWELSEELGEDEASVTVSSPESAFWSATVMRHCPDPEDVLRAVVAVFEEEYDDVDVVRGEATLANRQVPFAEVDFLCLDMTNTASMRALCTSGFTLLIMYQGTDRELKHQEPVLEAISDSLVCEADVEPLL